MEYMELIERAAALASLRTQFEHISKGEGHCVFISGEAGIGKTSLVKTFCREHNSDCIIYQGTCDALFTPRPLAPLYDISLQIGDGLWQNSLETADRVGLFTRFFHELSHSGKPVLLVFEDIHWADEATLDFIKFLVRRINRLRCFFMLTYRDNEIHPFHPLRNVLGQLPTDCFSRLQLEPLSRQAVEKMAAEKGYRGEDVYSISGGIPFYVNEILASYSPGIPDNIKDSILAVYNRQPEARKHVWRILSVLPTGFEISYLQKMEPTYAPAIENCLALKILIEKDGQLFFKHELYRRTVEAAISPLERMALNKRILDLFLENFEQQGEITRIVHHARNANEYELVVRYAPVAALQAASVGAHVEASKLYLSAIDHYRGNDKDLLVQLYQSYSYECYLTNQIKEAIVYQEKALQLWEQKNDVEKTGDCMRFLSRLWWFHGNRGQAERYGRQAIEVLGDQPSSVAKAMALSNMSQLSMLSDHTAECILWGDKAIAMAQELRADEILTHALNNVGSVQMKPLSTRQKGIEQLQQSLAIALTHAYHEHAARAYTNLGSNSVAGKEYAFAKEMLQQGIRYCEERDLDSWKAYMHSWQARLYLETGQWDDAYHIAERLLKNEGQAPIIKITALTVMAAIRMRKGNADALPLLQEAKAMAFEARELQRIIPVLVALLEYEWITGKEYIEKEAIDGAIGMMEQMGDVFAKNEFAFWLWKARRQRMLLTEWYDGYQVSDEASALRAAALWEQLGCPYAQSIALFEGGNAHKRKAISIVHRLGATAIYGKMKLHLQASGMKSIPRGVRKATRSNPALLTDRELDVLQLLKEGMQNKEIAAKLYISAKTVDHHISAILFKLDVKSRVKAVQQALRLGISG